MTRRALLVCDAGVTVGVGHVMRCLALAEELQQRGFAVQFACDVTEIGWVERELRRRGFDVWADEDPVATVEQLRPEVVVVDSYLLPREAYAALRAAAGVLVALVDGDPDDREADVYLDQNLGAEHDSWRLARGARRLAGPAYALIRDDVRVHRDLQGRSATARPSRVLVLAGGTDPRGAGPLLTRALADTGLPFEATVVAAAPSLREAVLAVPSGPGQDVRVLDPGSGLGELAAAADLVVSAAGTSTWELCCVGAALALVVVADNQIVSYGRALEAGIAAGLGSVDQLAADPAAGTAVLSRLLADPGERQRLRAAAAGLVDGLGRARLADAVEARLAVARVAQEVAR